MKKFSVKKLALAGMFCALCVVGSVFSFPTSVLWIVTVLSAHVFFNGERPDSYSCK